MYSTIVYAAVFFGEMLLLLAMWSFFLRLGLKWAKAPHATLHNILLATTIVNGLHFAFTFLFLLADPSSIPQWISDVAFMVVTVIAAGAVISWVFRTPFLRSLQAWVPTLLANGITVAIAILLIRPLLYDAFEIPTNAMAPTLVGMHREGICPECGQPAFFSSHPSTEPMQMICASFHVHDASATDELTHLGDRILVARFLNPRRWDLIVFQYPQDPSVMYVKRLVGLPGETVEIENGSVWIDGYKQTPPAALNGIEYLSEMQGYDGRELWGSPSRPAVLGADEYFVLGDFSLNSADSRFWSQGVPGHNPFAVPHANVRGVVTHTFWPLHRLRIHR